MPSTVRGTDNFDSAQVVGQNQTWQNVTASRAASTTYTNTTGRPIMVSISTNSGSGATSTLTVGGVVVCQGVNANTTQLTAIVPAGATYSHTNTYGFSIWAELR